jgi:putative phosphoesterase
VSGPRQVARVGVISDTHGGVMPAALAAFEGVDAILHAGDVGDEWVLEVLGEIAPVTAVRGNDDRGTLAHELPVLANVAVGGVRFLVTHRLGDLEGPTDPVNAGVRVVVSGHTHLPDIAERDGVLYVNPGSAFLPRGGNPPSVAIVRVFADGSADAEIVPLV